MSCSHLAVHIGVFSSRLFLVYLFLSFLGYSVAEPEPGAVEPPYFAGAGAVILVKNGSGSGLAKNDFLK